MQNNEMIYQRNQITVSLIVAVSHRSAGAVPFFYRLFDSLNVIFIARIFT